MYISGAPGCGKTGLLRELHLHFQTYEQENVSILLLYVTIIIKLYIFFKNINPSIVLYINCMQLQTPDLLFKHLCEALHIENSSKTTKKMNHEQLLRNYLAQKPKAPAANKKTARSRTRKRNLESNDLPPRGMIVLIADEIDRLKTPDNHVLYSLFELPAIQNSPLVLLSIANALDMTDRILPRLLNSHCL